MEDDQSLRTVVGLVLVWIVLVFPISSCCDTHASGSDGWKEPIVYLMNGHYEAFSDIPSIVLSPFRERFDEEKNQLLANTDQQWLHEAVHRHRLYRTIYDEKKDARDRAEAQLVQDAAAAAQANAQPAPANNGDDQNNVAADAAGAEQEQENAAAVIPTEADYMRELHPITHKEHIDVDYYHIPNVNMIESLNLAAVRDLNTQDIEGDNVEQGCIDSRPDVIRAHIRFLIDTDVTFTSEGTEYPAPNETYVLPHVLEEPKKKAVKKVPEAPVLEDERDPFLDGDDDDEEEHDSGKKKKRRSASPAPQRKGRYPLRTPKKPKTKTK